MTLVRKLHPASLTPERCTSRSVCCVFRTMQVKFTALALALKLAMLFYTFVVDVATDQACQVLHAEATRVAAEEFVHGSPRFDFNNWEFFGNNDVLHAKLDVAAADGRRLSAVAERLHGEFEQLGFTTENFRHPYSPHMTVWKTSRDRELIKSLNARRIPDEPSVQDDVFQVVASFNNAAETSLGTEYPRSIELLNMKEKEEDGYYKQVASAFWCSG
ncbi:hypothetical protein, variant 2 [Phytophthora nicotianae CJ01A1]|uniref:A-kinase anchor protein 7-like phosphoesterase domain-containing protein n=6 Tax=Phytophthora nicotianae TaxID=4792 RepID=W2QF91_PHYN3|nr:hypothetical protein, variant 2 [Phytophthora nicotianae INRA-310]ETI50665.1 hypothetical protein, variant 2 [Phytophthora nicotianae P1569]ETK90579.1 hypothetical protein, variant 2 [Phytophthora nicotianae]ETO79436.1 hypothetical protein, variant 2 [Phytophthora nicotianae P1976]ETP20440.1 hypothetical protein, variant 2 [Phytophthora nicotianae CJ01A1]ETP48439.1 hypothetical protein, variant 2 [Phytophthora nicotianae P10297]